MPATPNLALFLSSMAKLQSSEAASLLESMEFGDRMRVLRWRIVSLWANECFKLGLRERLNSTESERI